jgi:predicted SAM-dependent methyltransferase
MADNNAKLEFDKFLKNWTISDNRFLNGIDIGCGTSRISDMITSIDKQPDYRYAHAQLVWDCRDLEIFNDNKLDFIFSSHVLEDFEDIPEVFFNWWKKLKPDGLMLLLLPDMETGRYPKVDDPRGNPSHRTNVGKNYILSILEDLRKAVKIEYEVLQIDTIPHNESSSIDFVIRKKPIGG